MPLPLAAARESTATSFSGTLRRFQLDGLRRPGNRDLDGRAAPALRSA